MTWANTHSWFKIVILTVAQVEDAEMEEEEKIPLEIFEKAT
jgi:hypothetical protein